MAYEEEAKEIIEICGEYEKILPKDEFEELVGKVAEYLDDLVAQEVETALENYEPEPQFDWSELD